MKTEPMTKWPFDLWMLYAQRRFGISPNVFWEMSVCDFLILLNSELAPPINQTCLQALMKTYPDESTNEHAQ